MKKAFSIVTLVFTVGITVAPFIPKSTCPESCCKMNIHHMDAMEANSCGMSMEQCDYPVFFPLVAVQLDHQVASSDGYIPASSLIELPLVQELTLAYYSSHSYMGAPPGYLTPLRV